MANIELGSDNTSQYSVFPSGNTLYIPVSATGCKVYNDTIKGTWKVYETTSNCYNVAVPGIVKLANGKTLNCNNCYFAESEATIETSGGTITGSNNQFSVSAFGFVNESAEDFHLISTSVLKDNGTNTPALSADIEGIRVPFGSTPDIGAHEYYESLFTVTGNNTEIDYSVFDGQNQNIIGIVIPSIYSGTKIRNTTVVNCSAGGINVGGDIELSNSILRNNAGDDIFINNDATVTVGGANYIQDSSQIGNGTYSTGGYNTTWNGSDPFRRFSTDLNLDINSDCIDAGNNSLWSGTADITDFDLEVITDSDGNIDVPGGTIDIGARERYWKEKIMKKHKPGKVMGIMRIKIGRVMGRQ